MSNFLKEVNGVPRGTAMVLADLPSIANNTFLGNISGSAGTPSALTATQVTANLNLFTSSLQGLTPSSGGGTANFLRADGTWAVPPGSGSGTVTSVGMTVPSFLSVSPASITTSGTFAVTLSGTALPVANGGTNATTAAAAFNNLNPMTTTGDIIYEVSAGTAGRLAIGTAGSLLESTGTAPQWLAPGTNGQLLASTGTGLQYINQSVVGTVVATYYASAINNGSPTQSWNFDTKIIDTNNAVTASAAGTGSWKFTVPVTGNYQVEANIVLTSNTGLDIQIYKNGTIYIGVLGVVNSGNGVGSGSIIIPLNSGDYIDLRSSISANQEGGSLSGGLSSNISIALCVGTGNYGSSLYSGGFQNGSSTIYWGVTTSTISDFTATGTPTLTQNFNSNMGTVTAAASNYPGITISSAPKTGTLKITVTCSQGNQGGTGGSTVLLTDGSNTVINAGSVYSNISGSAPTPITIIGYYSVTAGTSYTFKLRGKTGASEFYLGSINGYGYICDFSAEYVQ